MRYRLIASLPVYTGLYIASLVVAFLLRFDLRLTPDIMDTMWIVMPYFLVIKTAVFICGSEWRRYHRYTTMSDLAYIIGLRTVASTLTFAFFLTGLAPQSPPRSVLLIDWLLTLLGLGLALLAARLFFKGFFKQIIAFGVAVSVPTLMLLIGGNVLPTPNANDANAQAMIQQFRNKIGGSLAGSSLWLILFGLLMAGGWWGILRWRAQRAAATPA